MLVRYKKTIIVGLTALFTGLVVFSISSYLVIGSYSRYMYSGGTTGLKIFLGYDPVTLEYRLDTPLIGIVFGGGVDERGNPKPLLEDRLRTAAELMNEGVFTKLIVSGDNRFANYDEPAAMKNYLVNKLGMDNSGIYEDKAGRSTYETCERAVKIFNVKRAVLISESTHLPRAIYLCRSFGLEAYGYTSDGVSSSGLKVGQRFRETMARTKAVLNVYIMGEKTVLGQPIDINN